MNIEVTLPWPPRDLSPNVRVHWSKKAKAAKAYRTACGMLTLVAYQQAKKKGVRIDPDHAVRLSVEFIPPNRRGYDRDNLVAWMKSGFDGMADALSLNDRMFRLDSIAVSDDLAGMVRVGVAQ